MLCLCVANDDGSDTRFVYSTCLSILAWRHSLGFRLRVLNCAACLSIVFQFRKGPKGIDNFEFSDNGKQGSGACNETIKPIKRHSPFGWFQTQKLGQNPAAVGSIFLWNGSGGRNQPFEEELLIRFLCLPMQATDMMFPSSLTAWLRATCRAPVKSGPLVPQIAD